LKAKHHMTCQGEKKRQLLKEYGLQLDANLNKNNLPCKHILNFYILVIFLYSMQSSIMEVYTLVHMQ
jgi:hypothetical protein